MQAVGADQEVVAGGAAVGGAHGDGTAVVRYFGDRLAVADPCACLPGTLAEDGGEVGAVHAQGGWEVVAAGPHVIQHGDDGAGGVRGAQAEGAERVALRLDLLPDAQLAEDPQGVPLQRDSRAKGLRGIGLLQDFNLDSRVGQQDGGGQSRGSRPDDSDVLSGVLTETDFINESEVVSEKTVHNTSVGTEGDKWSWDSKSVLYVIKNHLKFSDKLVKDVATSDVVRANTRTSVTDCALKMKQKNIEQIPVTNVEGELVGLVRATDLIKALTD